MTSAPGSLACSDPAVEAGAIGIKRVEVFDADPAQPVTVLVTFTPLPGDVPDLASVQLLDRRAYALTGGARLHPHVIGVAAVPGHPEQARLELDQAGDFSVYTLTLLSDRADPLLSSMSLRFRLACEHPFDCRGGVPAPPPPPDPGVVIDYLAKDYASFRQGLVDFVATRFPEWSERSEADVGMVLLELLAATGDTLSYLQDRIANEAFLATATQRRSVQGHLSLLGYAMDEGASAHAWLQFQVARRQRLAAGFAVTLRGGGRLSDLVFETMAERLLDPEQNEIRLYDGGNPDCCLPRNALTALLVGTLDTLNAGDSLVFRDDRLGFHDIVRLTTTPTTIAPPPSSMAAGLPPLTQIRWTSQTPLQHDYCSKDTVVQGNLVLATEGLTRIQHTIVPGSRRIPPSQNAVVSPPEGVPGTTFQVSAFGFGDDTVIEYTVQAPDGQLVGTPRRRPVSQPGGLDGESIATPGQAMPGVWTVMFTGRPSGKSAVASFRIAAASAAADGELQSKWLRIALDAGPLAHLDASVIEQFRPAGGSIPDATGYARKSLPQLRLLVDGVEWQAVPTLVESGPSDEVYRIEIDDEGSVTVIFGQGGDAAAGGAGFGRRPAPGVPLDLTYRVGGGAQGNVGADMLTTPLEPADPAWFISVTNPLPASGGRDPESRDHAARVAPRTVQQRLVAVTAADYETAARDATDDAGAALVARARADFRWTGTWLTVTLAVDPKSSEILAPQAQDTLLRFLDGRRLAGYDLQLRPANYLPLQLTLRVCVRPDATSGDVQKQLERALGVSDLGHGSLGFFHPDNFTFGTPVAISRLYDAVVAVPGVDSAVITTLAPLHAPDALAATQAAKASGYLAIGPDQIIQLDNDPNFPERGRLTLVMIGGR